MSSAASSHSVYLGWTLAGQACWWSFIFTWTTFFGLLRDSAPSYKMVMWLVGALFLVSAGVRLRKFSRGKALITEYLVNGSCFYGAAMFCAICAGFCSWHYKLSHVPVLPDLGFQLVPEAPEDSFLRQASNILAVGSATLVLFRQLVWKQTKVVNMWFRCMSINYVLRAFTLGLTMLPGPAEHCRAGFYGTDALGQPLPYSVDKTGEVPAHNHWLLVAGRVGAMYGAEENCGDLIFSGHTAFTITSLLASLDGVSKWPGKYHKLALAVAALYGGTFMLLCLSARKHYTVDVWLGMVVSVLVWLSFSESWIPPFYRQHKLRRD